MKKLSVEISVGLFMIAGFLCFVYMSVQLGEFSIFSNDKSYSLSAEFDSISGLKSGAELEIAGVNVGMISSISLGENDRALVTMKIDKEVKVTEDAIASIRTQGIIGDKYIRIIQGGADDFLQDGDEISETESAIDIEELVSKYIFGDV